MKSCKPYLLLFLALLAPAMLLLVSKMEPGHEWKEEEEEETGADRQLASWFQQRAYPDPYYLNDKYQAAWKTFLELQNYSRTRSHRVMSATWTSIGPSQNIGGRILCIAIDPGNSNILWAGSASGGLWKSVNGGSSWNHVVTNLPLMGVSSILIDPTNSNTIYAGTGEVYRSGAAGNIGFNVWKSRGTYGIGIIKSTDGGNSWTQVLMKNTSDLFAIQAMQFDPNNVNTIYACATDGLYRSRDAGTSWNLILNKTYVADIAIDPSNSNRIVVSVGNMVDTDKGIYYTTNGTLASPAWSVATGLPSFEGFIRLDNVGSALLASVGGAPGNELYSSSNFGQSWAVKGASAHCGGQYWFSHDLDINPFNTDSIMMAGVDWYRYRVSISNRTNVAGPGHADVHDIEYDPSIRGVIYVACDGGVYKSTNGGNTFTNMNNGLAATQFYASIATHPTNPDIIVGGLQDNNIARFNGVSWAQYTGGDGGPCAFSSTGTLIASHDARNIFQSTNGGTIYNQRLDNLGIAHNEDRRTAFMAPVAISPSNPSIIYVASDNLHISTDGGASFSRNLPAAMTRPIEQNYKTAIAMAVSPVNPNKVYVSTSPFSQNNDNSLNVNPPANVLKSMNASNINAYSFTGIKNSLPDRFVMDFAVSKTNDDSVYVVLGGFGTSHVYVTPDGGTTWNPIGNGLPDIPFNAILVDPTNPKVIYAGCDLGVYVSPNRGANWYDYNNGFWDATLVTDLQVTADNQLVAATHGKGVFKSALYSGTLPVDIIRFTGQHESTGNRLLWTTENEENLSRFYLERSNDGRTFSVAGTVAATNVPGTHQYEYLDATTSPASPVYYYRLKSVDLDGTFRYSNTVVIRQGNQSTFEVLGNPFHDKLTIQWFSSQQGQVQFHLFDATGRMVIKAKKDAVQGINRWQFDLPGALPRGAYILEMIIEGKKQVKKLQKQ